MRWQETAVALALLLVLEGILPFLSPSGVRRILLALSNLSDPQIRFSGLTSMLIGLILLYIINS